MIRIVSIILFVAAIAGFINTAPNATMIFDGCAFLYVGLTAILYTLARQGFDFSRWKEHKRYRQGLYEETGRGALFAATLGALVWFIGGSIALSTDSAILPQVVAGLQIFLPGFLYFGFLQVLSFSERRSPSGPGQYRHGNRRPSNGHPSARPNSPSGAPHNGHKPR